MNSTDGFTEAQKVNLFRYSLFIVEGLILTGSNFLIPLTVARHQGLRSEKEYIMIAGLSLVDGIDGIASMSAGTHRIILIFNNLETSLTSMRNCFFVPSNFIWCFSHPLQGLMLAVLAFDRLLSVVDPLRYLTFTDMYALAMIGTAISSGLVTLTVSGVTTWSETEVKYNAQCLYSWSVWGPWQKFIKQIRFWGTATSMILYFLVLVFVKKNTNKVIEQATAAEVKRKLKQQRRITKSLGISCFFTFIFFALPTFIQMVLIYLDISCYFFCPYAYIIMNINPILNLFIYVKRHAEIRAGIKALVTNKTMPIDISMWPNNDDQTIQVRASQNN